MYQKSYPLKIAGKLYQVPYPNVGELLQIETLKSILSNGRYGQISLNASKTSDQLLNIIDAVSYFSILIPELKEKLGIENFQNLDIQFQMQLSKAFVKFNNKFLVPVEQELAKTLMAEDEDEEPVESEA